MVHVKKISNYITRKVADKLKSLFTENREDFEKKWNDIKIVLEYGMLSEENSMKKQTHLFCIQQLMINYFTLRRIKRKPKRKPNR